MNLDQIRQMLRQLADFHWSPDHPSSYVIKHPDTGKDVGIGIIAMVAPGAFNLTYAAMNGQLGTMADHEKAVGLFIGFDKIAKLSEIDDTTLESFLTLLTQAEFKEWIQDDRNAKCIRQEHLKRLCDALRIPELRRV